MEDIITNIIESIREGYLALFCGAGISRNSGLPIANELKQSILERLPLKATDRDEIMRSNLPFEAFIETLSENTDISKLLDIFEQGTPNTNHILIARMAKAGLLNTIATTNFDLLIERALEGEGLIRGKDFRVYYDEQQFSEIDFEKIDDWIIRIFKLHGTVDARESIRTTMKSVASRTLSDKRMNLIRYLFSTGSHRKILILGYSCSDEFDITPQIGSLAENLKEIILVDHSGEGEKTEDVKTKDNKNPFKRFTGTRVICNADNFLEKLWKTICPEEYELVLSQAEWAKYIDEWAKGLEKDRGYLRYFMSGLIFHSISNFQRAIEDHQQALKTIKAIGNKPLKARCYMNLGGAYYGLGRFRWAIKYQQQALEIAQAIGDKALEAICYGNLGIGYGNLGDFQQAIEYHKQALKLTKTMGNKTGEARYYTDLGGDYNELGDFQVAIGYHEQALEIVQAIGDKALEAMCYGNLGVGYYELRDFHRAIEYNEQALKLSKAIGDKSGETKCYINLGNAYYALGNCQQAIKHHQHALEIAQAIRDKDMEGSCYGNLGVCHHELGNFQQEIEYHKQALKLVKAVRNRGHEAKCYTNLGGTYCKLEEFQRAIEYLLNAEKLFKDTDQSHHLKTVYHLLSQAYKNIGDNAKAEEYNHLARSG